jgi:DNA polymerase-3 subunit delta
MTPDQFLARLAKTGPEPAYLFLGPEPYERDRCRRALLEAALAQEDRAHGTARYDLEETTLTEALDEARALSLFAPRRLVWLAGAEGALPRGSSAETQEEGPDGAAALAEYLHRPTPGTVLVIDCARYGFEGEDKARLQRVEKFYSAVAAKVEFRPFTPEAARALAQKLVRERGLQLGLAELALLLEATAGDAARLAQEIEKLSLYAGQRKVTAADIQALVPHAPESNLFALVEALGRGDRTRALELLDALAREGEYMPLALTFLGGQFRMALAAREARLRGASQIQAHFSQLGARIWPARARQIEQTVAAFPQQRLERAIEKVFEADRALRDARPDDRIVMEEMILALTAP